MGEKIQEFRLGTREKIWMRVMVVACFAWAMVFVVFGLRVSNTGAASGDALIINSIDLNTVTEPVQLVEHRFTVPDYAVGAYYANENKIFLMGHKATIFRNLKDIQLGDEIVFGEDVFMVKTIEVKAKDEIDMSKILAAEKSQTLILMTCHGESLGGGDYSHRLIVTAAG